MDQRNLPLPNYFKADYSSLDLSFNYVEWWTVFQPYRNTDDLYKRFCHVVYSGLSRHVPIDLKRIPVKRYPKQISNHLAQKPRLFNSLKDPLLHPQYKKICQKLDHHLKRILVYKEKLASRNYNKSLACLEGTFGLECVQLRL